MDTIPTNKGPMTPAALIDELTYINYRANRGYSPHITPESWKKLYGPATDAMEARYQAELAIEKAQGEAA